ncbi:MAG: patatin-like phospholipase family protein [Polyangia bacterium]
MSGVKHDRCRGGDEPRIALVLGAGGPVGHAFHAGSLAALEDVIGWDPRRADVLMGTSAGAEVAALLRAGLEAADLPARIAGEPLSPKGTESAANYLRPDHGPFPFHLYRPLAKSLPVWLGDRLWRRRRVPGPLLAALLPLGEVDLTGQELGFTRMFPGGWPKKNLWLVSMRVGDGRRVVLGRGETPRPKVGEAVTASGALPGVNPPVEIDGSLYVDGGLRSATNLDLLLDEREGPPPERVLVSSPLTCAPRLTPSSWIRPARLLLAHRLAVEIRALRRRGIPVHVLQPSGAVLSAMGINPFSVERMEKVARAARRATGRALRRAGRGSMAQLENALTASSQR